MVNIAKKKLAALQVREKAESKAIKADETAALKRRTDALEQVTSADKAAEKARNRAVANEVNVERKKLEKLGKDVSGHKEVREAAFTKLALRIAALEKETADKVLKWKKEHEAAMDKLTAVAEDLKNRTVANLAKEEKNAGMSADFAVRMESTAADVDKIRQAVEAEFGPKKTVLTSTIDGLRKHEKEAQADIKGKL